MPVFHGIDSLLLLRAVLNTSERPIQPHAHVVIGRDIATYTHNKPHLPCPPLRLPLLEATGRPAGGIENKQTQTGDDPSVPDSRNRKRSLRVVLKRAPQRRRTLAKSYSTTLDKKTLHLHPHLIRRLMVKMLVWVVVVIHGMKRGTSELEKTVSVVKPRKRSMSCRGTVSVAVE